MATTYDIRILQANGRQSIFDVAGGAVVSGALKLAQRVIIELLTEQGTLQYFPERGTLFLKQLREKHMSEGDVMAAFYAAEVDLVRNLQLEEAETDSEDERYDGSNISEIVVTDGAVSLKLRVYALSGGITEVQVPTLIIEG